MSGSAARFRVAADIAEDWMGPIRRREQPETWPLGGGGFADVEIGPGIVMALGGPPASGKTALCLQWTTDALRAKDDLFAVVCNVEMSPASLLERTLARVSGVSLSSIRKRDLNEQEAERLEDGFATIATFADRLAFVDAPFSMTNLAATLDAFAPGSPVLVIADYVQRIAPPSRGKGEDGRTAINATMSLLREFASNGCGVIVCSSLSRSKDRQGRSTYSGEHLGLASFRESGEVEFAADSAYLLVRDDRRRDDPNDRLLRCVKNRHGEEGEWSLDFDGSLQRFAVAAGASDSIASTKAEKVSGDASTLADLRRYWRDEDAADANEAAEEARGDGE